MRLALVSRDTLVKLGAGFVAGLLMAALAFCLFAPGAARPIFVTHLAWRLDPPRVGIQAGHAETYNAPEELQVLRGSIGAFGGDWGESIVNLDIAQRVAKILQGYGLVVDVLPTTVPIHYKADAFLALHADAWESAKLSGFKATRGEWGASKYRDDMLVACVVSEYAAGTGLPEHRASISDNMMEYYAFNSERFEHSVDPTTPAAILEMGFMTNESDRRLLQDEPDRVANSVASGILKFLEIR